jgi:PAS domain S-box-containing protein
VNHLQKPSITIEFNRRLFDKIPQHVWFTSDSSGQILYFNQQWKNFTGLEGEEIESPATLELVHPEDRPVLADAWQKSLTQATPLDVFIRMISSDNQWRWFQILANPVIENGVVTNWVGTNTDVHEQRVILLELQRSEQQRHSTQEMVSKITSINQLAEMLEYVSQKIPEVVGNDMLKVGQLVGPRHLKYLAVRGFDQDQVYPGFIWEIEKDTPSFSMLQTQQPMIVDDITQLNGEAKTWFVKAKVQSAAFFPLSTHYGVFGEICVGFRQDNPRQANQDMVLMNTISKMIARNIERIQLFSELHQLNYNLEQQIIHRTNELRNRTQELEAFVFSASHDLRAPLSMMLAASRRIRQQTEKTSVLSRVADSVQDAAERMNQMLNVMLELARGKKSEVLGLVNVNKVIQQVLDSLETQIIERNVQVTVGFEHLQLIFGESELYQVLQNILQNAVKFAGSENQAPWIEIKATENQQGTWLEISNNTQPLPEAILPRLFDLFYTSDSQQGMGIGLTIVKRIIERYGARVWLEADDQFRVHLWFPKP